MVEKQEVATERFIPIFLPTEDGVSGLHLGAGKIEDNVLTITLDENFPATAVKRMLTRGEVLGLSFVMLEEDENASERIGR